jgi:hypothetical protein
MKYTIECDCGWSAELWSISGTQTASTRHRRFCSVAKDGQSR